MLMKTGILYFTTRFHGFGILRHVDPFVRMLHILHPVNLTIIFNIVYASLCCLYSSLGFVDLLKHNLLKALSANIFSNVDPLSYLGMCIECITDPLVTVDDVMTVISHLNNSVAGHDGLPASVEKKLSNDYVVPLTHFINMPIIQGDFHDTLKIAKVILINKGDDEQMVQNYHN